MSKAPTGENITLNFNYNFLSYFKDLINGKSATFKTEKTSISILAKPFNSWEDFAKKVAWYGRKDSNSTHIKTAKLNGDN